MSRRAFTLVELLVVIGIIALLIGIFLPTLSWARQSAQCIQCASNLRNVMYSWLLYANDNNGYLAPCNDGTAYPGLPAPPGTYGNCVYYLVDNSGNPNIEFIDGAIMSYLSKTEVTTRQKLIVEHEVKTGFSAGEVLKEVDRLLKMGFSTPVALVAHLTCEPQQNGALFQ